MNKEKQKLLKMIENELIQVLVNFLKEHNYIVTNEEARTLIKNTGVNIAIEDGDLTQVKR